MHLSERINLEDRIVHIEDKDIRWAFESGDKPTIWLYGPDTKDRNGKFINIDPFPCYAHPRKLVLDTVMHVETSFPIKFKPNWFLLEIDTADRTNGTAYKNHIYYRGDERVNEFDPFIVLSGKRIPLHPAMTRYLCGHEYGHIVQNWIEFKRGIKDETTTELDKEYAALRNLKLNNDYGARKWHTNIGEIFANDFRICVTGLEPDFYPHKCSHPLETPAVQEFWHNAVKEFGYFTNDFSI